MSRGFWQNFLFYLGAIVFAVLVHNAQALNIGTGAPGRPAFRNLTVVLSA
jgi:hypothetical protein